MQANEWNRLLAEAVPWAEAYPAVEREARAYLQISFCGAVMQNMTTGELVEKLYSEQFAKGEGITARKRIYKALAALATRGLADCCTKGEPRPLKHNKKKLVRPWLWHAPRTVVKAKIGDIVLIDGAQYQCVAVGP